MPEHRGKTGFSPSPFLATTRGAEILAARVNKPTLSPNLSVLGAGRAAGMKRLLVIGVGCQIQALRAVEDKLGLEKLYVLGTPCVDKRHPGRAAEVFSKPPAAPPKRVVPL